MIRYSEIFLKSDPVRRQWENILLQNILAVLPGCTGWTERGRLWIEGEVDSLVLKRVFGIVSFSRVDIHPLEELHYVIVPFAQKHDLAHAKSFAIRVKRVGKHDFNSQEKAAELGSIVFEAFPHLKVNLKDPDKELFVHIHNDTCYLYDTVEKGAGGIPLGVEGTLVGLVSGGIDSPVAMYLMMKRGCKILPIYVHLHGYLDDASLERTRAVIEILRKYQPDLDLLVVDDNYLTSAKQLLVTKHLDKLTCVFCKRRMYRIAEKIACDRDAKGIVTGESLGQVASQTLDNLLVLSEATTLPMYRPLIGFDKEEILKIAREIGTFKSSTIKTGGCGAVPKPPATKAKLDLVKKLESELDPIVHTLPEIS